MGSAHWTRGRTPGFYPCRGDQSLITMATAEDQQKKSEMNDQLREYISQWRDERAKEEAELKRLKDKQAARKEIRAEQEKKQAAQKRITRRRRRKRSRFKAGPNFHHHLLGLKSKSYPCNKRHSIRVIASIPRGFLRPAEHRPVSRKVHNLQFVIAICLETRQVPVRICYALKIRSPK